MKKITMFITAVITITLLVSGGVVVLLQSSANKSSETELDSNDLSEARSIDLTNQTEVAIDISESGYSMPDIKVKKGTKVIWVNRDTTQHNVMTDHEGSSMSHDPSAMDTEPSTMSSPLLADGESYSFVFNETGEVAYHCASHTSKKGSVMVVE